MTWTEQISHQLEAIHLILLAIFMATVYVAGILTHVVIDNANRRDQRSASADIVDRGRG